MTTYDEKLKAVLGEISDALSDVDPISLLRAANQICISDRIVCVGAGRMGMMMKAFAMRLHHIGFFASYISDSNVQRLQAPRDLLIVGTGSGLTPSMFLFAQQAKAAGATVMCITASPDSLIAQLSHHVIAMNAVSGFEGTGSIQPMKTSVEQSLLILLDILALTIIEHSGSQSEDLYKRHSRLE